MADALAYAANEEDAGSVDEALVMEVAMHATAGDHIVVESPKVGGHRRDGKVLEAQGPDGGPPFLVQWEDSDEEALVYPGPDAHIEQIPRQRGTEKDH